MVTTTMNGWSLTSVPLALIKAGGHSTLVRAGAVATVLGHVARRFHAEVEPLVTFHGWRSVATNAAVGGHPRSNHPSGTAFDANGYRHPYRAPVNFTAAQVAAIRRILAEVTPVVRWGGDFGAALRDGMHFEIVGAAAQVAAVAARLTTQPAPTPVPTPAAPPDVPLEVIDMRQAIIDIFEHYTGFAPSEGQVREFTAFWMLNGAEVTAQQIRDSAAGQVAQAFRDELRRYPESQQVVAAYLAQFHGDIAKIRAALAASPEGLAH